MIIDSGLDALYNVLFKVKQLIHAIHNHDTYSSITYNRDIPSGVNTLKNIHLNYNLFGELFTTFYNEIISMFNYLSLTLITQSYLKNVIQTLMKYHMRKIEYVVGKPSYKKKQIVITVEPTGHATLLRKHNGFVSARMRKSLNRKVL